VKNIRRAAADSLRPAQTTTCAFSHDALDRRRCNPQATQTVYWILAASKGWIKQTYRKIMHTQNTQYTQNHITGNELVQIE